jgi:uncharacterized membrane protein YqhA
MTEDEQTEPPVVKDKIEDWLDHHMEETLLNMRYITLIPVFLSYFGAVIMFIVGTIRAYDSALSLLDGELRDTQVALILAVDAYLMGLVLLIFSFGIYDLFISKIDMGNRPQIRPSWMKFKDIGGLKTTLAEVILIILTIEFFQLVLERMDHFDTFEEMLIIPIGMILIAVGMGIFKKLTHGSDPQTPKKK